ncbi:MAG: tRNA (N6-isopentenyl adenosine(37)-C2)-methylthiotransferase MiaB [Eubacteriales bacterium]|nr:tRNA (N6-isopentenyl adenosine(37)-C2)-methylthiotransferase MiaB [Eubacteriales bacterium]
MILNTYDFDAAKKAAPAEEGPRQYYFIEQARAVLRERFEAMVDSGEAMERYGSSLLGQLQAEGKYGTFHIETFGCQMNSRDSEKLAGVLDQAGYKEVDGEDADFVLYNTCTVRDNANQKVYGRLGYLNTLKKRRSGMMIALCGCMMQEPSVIEKIKKSYPFVDLIFGTHNIFKLAELLCGKLMKGGRMTVDIWEGTDAIVEELPVDRKYSFKSGVNIMFGCNNFCSYCIVPYVRGRERSRRPEDIIDEIRRLVADGVVEVMLLGQNVNSYGKNLEQPVSFAQLLRQVNEIEGLERIRFMTSHPKDLSDELIEAMRDCKKVCTHLHLPVQSGSSRILKIMNRHYTKESYLELVDKIRAAIPDISLTTDIIVGFPGETEEDFEETMDVVRRVRYDSAFTFIYSKRTGTPAAAMEQVPEQVVKERFDRLLREVQEISAQVCGRDEKTVQKVLVESLDDHKEGYVTGRMSNNTTVHFPGDESLIGRISDVYLEEAKGFYYMGRPV